MLVLVRRRLPRVPLEHYSVYTEINWRVIALRRSPHLPVQPEAHVHLAVHWLSRSRGGLWNSPGNTGAGGVAPGATSAPLDVVPRPLLTPTAPTDRSPPEPRHS